MKKTLLISAISLMLAAPAMAQQPREFVNPCERGPVPHWKFINSSRTKFIGFLQEVRPAMPHDVASTIAYEMCDDMALVGDSAGLTSRLRMLLTRYGY